MSLLCPTCQTDLVMAERQGVEIDYCPKCRGVWLDRGELDKIIERGAEREQTNAQGRASFLPQPPRQASPPATSSPHPAHARSWSRDDDDDDHHRGHPRRNKNWLSELFD